MHDAKSIVYQFTARVFACVLITLWEIQLNMMDALYGLVSRRRPSQ